MREPGDGDVPARWKRHDTGLPQTYVCDVATATILIVDDHPVFAGGFVEMARALRPEWNLRVASSATQALGSLRLVSPDAAVDLVVIDVCLPDEDGFGLLKTIAADWPGLPAVLISGREDAAVRVRARAAGAMGFVAKTASPQAIVDMIDTVLSGGTAFCDRMPASGLPVLSPRQAEVLALLAEGHANKEIRYRLGIAERTVRAHLTELFHLLGAHSRMQAVIRGRELGLIQK